MPVPMDTPGTVTSELLSAVTLPLPICWLSEFRVVVQLHWRPAPGRKFRVLRGVMLALCALPVERRVIS